MRYAIAPVALAAIANALPQGVTEAITPDTAAPAGCSPDYSGEFQIQVVNVTSSASKTKRQADQSSPLVLKLQGGILTDGQGRTGYIAANRQFQFDAPAQTGAIYTAGWSACQNGSLAIGGDAVFQQCLSGTFYNLYDEATEAQCSPVYIDIIGGGSSQPAASVMPDGQTTAAPVAQIPDGQAQGVSQIPDGQLQSNPSATPVQQIPDGQLQSNPTASPIQQIPDGQLQNPQTPTASPIQQIPDGQVQSPQSTGSPVQQIPDGQVQQPTGSPVQQIPDGQIQANNATRAATPSAPVQYTGAAALPTAHAAFGLAAGVLAIAML